MAILLQKMRLIQYRTRSPTSLPTFQLDRVLWIVKYIRAVEKEVIVTLQINEKSYCWKERALEEELVQYKSRSSSRLKKL